MATSIAATAAASTTAQLRFLTDAAHLLRQTAPETSAYLMHHRTNVLAQNLASSSSSSSSSSTAASNSIASSAQAALAFTQTDAQRQHVCTCCGHILVPGSNGTTLTIQSGEKHTKTMRSPGKRKREAKNQKDEKPDTKEPKQAKEAIHAGITKVFACGACNRETRIALPPPPPLPKNRRLKKPAAKEEKKRTQESAVPFISTAEHRVPARPQPSANPAVEAAPAAPAAPTAKSTNANSKKRAKNRKAGLLALLDKNKGNDSSGFGGLGLSFDDFRKR